MFKLMFVMVVLFLAWLIFKGIQSYKEYMNAGETLEKESLRTETLALKVKSEVRKQQNDEFEKKLEKEINNDVR